MPLTASHVLKHCKSAFSKMEDAMECSLPLVLMNGGYEKTFRDFLVSVLASPQATPLAEVATDNGGPMDIALDRRNGDVAAFELKHAFIQQKTKLDGTQSKSWSKEGRGDIRKLRGVRSIRVIDPVKQVSRDERFFIHLITSVEEYGEYVGRCRRSIGTEKKSINDRIKMLADGYRKLRVKNVLSGRLDRQDAVGRYGERVRVDVIVVQVISSER